ncbi:MAG: hypothetical protein IPJ88_04810 [Myxococcales bacterium]|nr:MAG: hypothetical protein IPJ88_04810 [Myxococcales bacterium]
METAIMNEKFENILSRTFLGSNRKWSEQAKEAQRGDARLDRTERSRLYSVLNELEEKYLKRLLDKDGLVEKDKESLRELINKLLAATALLVPNSETEILGPLRSSVTCAGVAIALLSREERKDRNDLLKELVFENLSTKYDMVWLAEVARMLVGNTEKEESATRHRDTLHDLLYKDWSRDRITEKYPISLRAILHSFLIKVCPFLMFPVVLYWTRDPKVISTRF